MARAIASIERFDLSGAGFDPWLFGICRNIIGDHFRRTSRDDRRVATQPSSVPDGTDGIERDEEAVAMRTAYERLSDGDRELLDLRVVAGLSADEVAVVLGKLPGTVRMAQSRAVSRLQQHFEEVYR